MLYKTPVSASTRFSYPTAPWWKRTRL